MRNLLLKLEARGWIGLPPRLTASVNGLRNRSPGELEHDQTPMEGALASWRPVRLEPVSGPTEALLFRFLLQGYHYLGYRNCVGQNLKYLARDRLGHPLACLLFNAAAWKVAARDRWIGWDSPQRQHHLHLVGNHARFVVLPWARVPHLASHLQGRVAARLAADWQQTYGQPIYLEETFEERDRFRGTCSRAAGWQRVGLTTGRSRNDKDGQLQVPTKEIYPARSRARCPSRSWQDHTTLVNRVKCPNRAVILHSHRAA